MKKPRIYSIDFKREVVRRMAEAEAIVALAKELGIPRPLLYRWRDNFQARNRMGLERRKGRPPGSRSARAADLRIAELERLLGRKQLEVDFLERAFEQVRGVASDRTGDGGKESVRQKASLRLNIRITGIRFERDSETPKLGRVH